MIRCGSVVTRHNHSNPIARINRGARKVLPAIKSKVPPTPAANLTVANFDKFSAIHCSCKGAPNATSNISGFT
ncbi:MAG: hypothetical protein A2295_00605 [Candidatus Jacksonbacteria bacterium RIFOXYB2_FULL_44_15]|nr:MAG: hypothetical protein A2240_01360 [Candidatus Jacksonbacteria bacterium RIFOXYA2_FULL_43_12]OGY77487.1 MAG: hypothetical protein A2295_00605 [Candidatus Jacksonbacteria bacterium RIFOXYB2_FULL_44_15]